MDACIARALAGDREAFSQLYDRYAPAALRLSAAITRDPDLAADAVQEAFLRVYRKGRQCRSTEDFVPWFHRIVINESRRVLRRQPEEAELTGMETAPSFAENSDLSLSIQAALDRLSEEHRTVLVLRYLLDHGEAEIGRILRIPRGTVKSRLHYARQALARELGEEEAQYDRI